MPTKFNLQTDGPIAELERVAAEFATIYNDTGASNVQQRPARDLLIRDAEGLALDRLTIVSPFHARIRYTVWAGFHSVAAHQPRHLWQAQRAAEAIRTAPHAAVWSVR